MIPQKTQWMKEQMAHEPSREYGESLYRLVEKIGYKRALEVGCAWGISTLAILTAGIGKLVTIDKSDYEVTRNEVRVNGLQDRWEYIIQESQDYFQRSSDETGTFDFIYIDGDHRYPQARFDLFAGWLKLEKGGVLAIDDSLHINNIQDGERNYGVSLASLELYKEVKPKDIGFEGRILWYRK